MTRALTLCLAVFLSVTLYGTNAVSLDCGELSAADCKIQFETKLEPQVIQILLNVYRKACNGYLEFWSALIRDLPENDLHVPVLRETVNKLREVLPKLNEDFVDPKNMADVIHEIGYIALPNFNQLNIDEESEKIFEEAQAKNGYKELEESYARSAEDIIIPGITGSWEKLYAGLRSIDLTTYPQYEDLNAQLQSSTDKTITAEQRIRNFKMFFENFQEFLNLPLIKPFENRH